MFSHLFNYVFTQYALHVPLTHMYQRMSVTLISDFTYTLGNLQDLFSLYRRLRYISYAVCRNVSYHILVAVVSRYIYYFIYFKWNLKC